MTLLATKTLRIDRKNSPPLNFPDLAIAAGSRTLLMGSSGCGKTTLLSMLAGLLTPTGGAVSWQGQDMYALSSRERDILRSRNFGFVFQTLHLLPSLSLRKNIELASDLGHVENAGARLDTLLQKLDLIEKADRKPGALSQGEQQRAAIARAVLNKPSILLADEPTSALDNTNCMRVMDLLELHAAETNAALLVATHDERIAHRFQTIIHLDSARIAA